MRSLPERTVDSLLAVELTRAFPAVRIWSPTNVAELGGIDVVTAPDARGSVRRSRPCGDGCQRVRSSSILTATRPVVPKLIDITNPLTTVRSQLTNKRGHFSPTEPDQGLEGGPGESHPRATRLACSSSRFSSTQVAYTMRSAGASVSPENLTPVSLTATDVAAPACGIGDRNAQRPARYRTSRGSLRAAQPRLTARAPAPGCCDRRRSATGRPASRRPRSRSPYAGRPEPRSRRRTGWRIR